MHKSITEVTLADMDPVVVEPVERHQLTMLPPPDVASRIVVQTTASRQDVYSTRPGFGLTPERVYHIFRQAEMGMPAAQCDLFEDVVENDGHLAGLKSNRIEAVSGRPWLVKPGDNTPLAQQAAKVLEDALVSANTDEFIEHHLDGVFNGFAFTEATWEFRDGWFVPQWFINVPHRRFVFDQLNDEPRLTTDVNPWPGERLVGSWICTFGRGRRPVRAGLMRTATWWSVFKRMSVRDWLVFAERFGIPIVMGVYKENASPETRAALEQAVQDIGEAGMAVLSQAAQIQFADVHQRSGDNTSLHPSVVALCNAELSKLIAGATLGVESGGPGSFALGRVHDGKGDSHAVRDAKRIASVSRQGIGATFYRLNGVKGRPPCIRCPVLPQTDQLTRVQVASILANELGLLLDEGQVRDEFDWRPPADGTSAVKGTIQGKIDARKTAPQD